MTTLLKRLLPTSLAGQIVALILVAVFLSQIVLIALFADDRRSRARAFIEERAARRLADAALLLQATDPDAHGTMLRTLSNPRIDLHKGPPRSRLRDSTAPDPAFAARVRAHFNDMGLAVRSVDARTGTVRVPHHRPARHPERPMGTAGPRQQGPPRDAPPPGPRRAVPMNLLTLGLDDGTTLTAVLRRTAGPSRSVPLILIVSSLTALILAAAMVWLARRLARPLDAMAAAADRLGTEQRPLPLAEKGPDEVRRTVAAFNRMGARLDRMLQDQRRMVAAVGHDLRTPITALRLRTEFIEDSENRERMIRILDEMQSMTEGILALVRADMAEENPRPTDLSALVQSLADDMADLGMAVDLGDLPPVVHPCRPAGLARAIRNLAENAVRYGGGASLDLARTDAGGVRIRVRDDGPGVPEEALEKVLDPFTRLESSRNSETGGLGLGLAIARMMAERDGGSLRLRNRAEGGLEATIDLPPPDPAATNGS